MLEEELSLKEKYEKSASLIKESDGILILAGAGIGVDSGLPDFRGDNGFWKAYPPYKDKGISFVEMANPRWFSNSPSFAWGFYGHRLSLYKKTTPHKGFDILHSFTNFTNTKSQNYFIFTSNVDGHFQKAGFNNDNILEIHGSIHHLQCLNECGKQIFEAPKSFDIQIDKDTMEAKPPLPECPRCQSLARPNILMFGDYAWDPQRQQRQYDLYNKWLSSFQPKDKLVLIECGAGTHVPTVRMQSEYITSRMNASLIRINVREPNVYKPHISIPKGALEALSNINDYI